MIGKKRIMFIIISIFSLLMIIGGTLAWLSSTTDSIKNIFVYAGLDIEVKEDFNNEIKENIFITNNGTTSAYIRVALVCSWVDEDGKVVGEPAGLDDLDILYGSDVDWFFVGGYYYYKYPVEAGGSTTNMIDYAEVITRNDYSFKLDVIADSIQANPDDAVEKSWSGVTVDDNGTLVKK